MAAIARRIALLVLTALNGSNTIPDHLLTQAFQQKDRPERCDRALANELVVGTFRWPGRLNWIIQHLSKTPVHRIVPFVLNIVWLGPYPILFLSRIPEPAAVNQFVELAKGKAPAWVVRFVNALLRSAARWAKDKPLPDDADDPFDAIGFLESHPLWMVKRWMERLVVEEARSLCRGTIGSVL